jgi:hypothetical protein
MCVIRYHRRGYGQAFRPGFRACTELRGCACRRRVLRTRTWRRDSAGSVALACDCLPRGAPRLPWTRSGRGGQAAWAACSSAKDDSIAALSAQAPTRPSSHAGGGPAGSRRRRGTETGSPGRKARPCPPAGAGDRVAQRVDRRPRLRAVRMRPTRSPPVGHGSPLLEPPREHSERRTVCPIRFHRTSTKAESAVGSPGSRGRGAFRSKTIRT